MNIELSEIEQGASFIVGKPWNFEDALNFCRYLEERLSEHEPRLHCGLTGSVLYKGESLKDLDIIIYPHKSFGGRKHYDYVTILNSIFNITLQEAPHGKYDDDKIVYWGILEEMRVDFFILE